MSSVDIEPLRAVLVGDADAEIVELEARLRAAQLAADVVALDALIAENLLFTGPDGNLATKAADLAAHATGAVRFRAHQPQELRIRRVGGDVAIAALRAWVEVVVSGAVQQSAVRYTRVWAREADAQWRVAAGHVSLLPSD